MYVTVSKKRRKIFAMGCSLNDVTLVAVTTSTSMRGEAYWHCPPFARGNFVAHAFFVSVESCCVGCAVYYCWAYLLFIYRCCFMGDHFLRRFCLELHSLPTRPFRHGVYRLLKCRFILFQALLTTVVSDTLSVCLKHVYLSSKEISEFVYTGSVQCCWEV